MKLKICGLNNRENISELLEEKPDYLGFIFYAPSPRFGGNLDPVFVNNISGVKKVGVFVNESEIKILDVVARYGLDYVQLHGDESPEFCALISGSVPVIKAFRVDDEFDMKSVQKYHGASSYFLFDSKTPSYGGSGQTFNHSKLEENNIPEKYFLSGGLSPENISGIKTKAHALDINSKFEASPGIKDIQKIKSLIKQLRA